MYLNFYHRVFCGNNVLKPRGYIMENLSNVKKLTFFWSFRPFFWRRNWRRKRMGMAVCLPGQ